MRTVSSILSLGFFFTLVLINGHTFAQDSTTNNLEAQIDNIFRGFDNINKPGAAVAVVQNQELVFSKGYGSANLEYNIETTPSTVFHVASVSKQFTVFSILLLEKQGKLSFDDDIRKYIPEVPDFGTTITLRHLASHTSGLRDQWTLLGISGWRFDDVITKEHILNIVAKQKELNFQPGEEYNYCNTGFTLLAEVVARISGKSFNAFTKENIFEPLGMNNTQFYDDHERIVKNRAYSYTQTGQFTYNKSVLNFANVGATSLFTTVEDLSQWAKNFWDPKVGDLDIINTMNTLATLNNGETFGGAYGQFVNTHKGLTQIQHGGADAGYRSYIGRFPDQNLAVMVFSNLAGSNPQALSLQVADLYLKDQLVTTSSNTGTNSSTANAPNYITLTRAQLEEFSGDYWNEPDSYARTIYVKNDTLMYSRGANNESALAPVSPNEFKMLNIGVDLRVRFNTQENPRQMIVTIDGGQPFVSTEFKAPNYTAASLQEFTGEYYSEELSTYYTVIVEDGKLTFRHYRNGDNALEAAKTDFFMADGYSFRFERDAQNQLTGVRVSAGRVRNLLFEKLK